jgi:hypothetical protein
VLLYCLLSVWTFHGGGDNVNVWAPNDCSILLPKCESLPLQVSYMKQTFIIANMFLATTLLGPILYQVTALRLESKLWSQKYFGVLYQEKSGSPGQGCQMVCFQTKNPSLGKFCRVLLWKILVYFMTIWSVLWPFGIFCGTLVYFSPFWYFGPRKIWQPCCRQCDLGPMW